MFVRVRQCFGGATGGADIEIKATSVDNLIEPRADMALSHPIILKFLIIYIKI
jgi:hypothetical protein